MCLARDDFLGRIYIHFNTENSENQHYLAKEMLHVKTYCLVEKYSQEYLFDEGVPSHMEELRKKYIRKRLTNQIRNHHISGTLGVLNLNSKT